jgi:hypothetical protein
MAQPQWWGTRDHFDGARCPLRRSLPDQGGNDGFFDDRPRRDCRCATLTYPSVSVRETSTDVGACDRQRPEAVHRGHLVAGREGLLRGIRNTVAVGRLWVARGHSHPAITAPGTRRSAIPNAFPARSGQFPCSARRNSLLRFQLGISSSARKPLSHSTAPTASIFKATSNGGFFFGTGPARTTSCHYSGFGSSSAPAAAGVRSGGKRASRA